VRSEQSESGTERLWINTNLLNLNYASIRPIKKSVILASPNMALVLKIEHKLVFQFSAASARSFAKFVAISWNHQPMQEIPFDKEP
jgi:hypothetical protein